MGSLGLLSDSIFHHHEHRNPHRKTLNYTGKTAGKGLKKEKKKNKNLKRVKVPNNNKTIKTNFKTLIQ